MFVALFQVASSILMMTTPCGCVDLIARLRGSTEKHLIIRQDAVDLRAWKNRGLMSSRDVAHCDPIALCVDQPLLICIDQSARVAPRTQHLMHPGFQTQVKSNDIACERRSETNDQKTISIQPH
jgi:hypothetical protein